MRKLLTQRLVIRNWESRDRDLFRLINSDPEVMHFFPFRRTPAEADAFMDVIAARIAHDGFGFAALERVEDGACIGFCGLARTGFVPARPDGAVEIGWRLAPRYQGKGYASEAARAWLAFGFDALNLDEIVSFAVAENHRSTAVMERIGMERDASGDFDHPLIPDTHPHLKKHVFYRLSRARWTDMQKAG